MTIEHAPRAPHGGKPLEAWRLPTVRELTRTLSSQPRRWEVVFDGAGYCGHRHRSLAAAERCATAIQRWMEARP